MGLVASGAFRPAIIRRIAPILALTLAATGCADTQNQKTMFGALGGGVVSSATCVLAHGNAVACALAGIGGAVIGGVIGHAFDERDRARRDAAVRQALYNQSLWQAVPGPLASTAPLAARGTDETRSTAADADAAPTQVAAAAAKRPRRQVAAAQAPPSKPVVPWQNPDTDDSGAVVALRTFASPTTGQACKVYREDYIKDGKPYSDTMQACPKPDGTFDIKALS